ncbi:MAG: hypothetical protein JW759_00480 [Candidatus Coatesbacteria bacterium]|nr:hypothetical protein [Candidatus Coatesbacteria bacterium]
MTKGKRANRVVLLFVALTLGLGLLANAQEAPDIIASGASPYLITYGDSVTFWANVALMESQVDVAVWIFYDFFPLMALEEVDTTDTFTRWEGGWTLPNLAGVVPPGDYRLYAVAVSSAGGISEPRPFILSITDHDPRVPVLLSPRDGSAFYRGMPIMFEWSSVPEATGYNFEIVLPDDQTVGISLPFFFTSLVVQPHIAGMLPDGEYRWRVQATFGDGPGDWAEYSLFGKNSQQGPPIQCEGLVTYIDTNEGMLQVESAVWAEDGTDQPNGATEPGYWGCWTVRVTHDTSITKGGEEITLDDVMIGEYVFVEGWLEEDNPNAGVSRCPLVTADRIEVTGSPWPEYVSGSVRELIPDERAFWLSELVYDESGSTAPSLRVLVRLTDGAVLTRMGLQIEFEDIQVGDLASATGHWQSSEDGIQYFLADSVDFSYGGSDWVYAEGTIERINYDNSTFVLSGTYSSGPNTGALDKIVVSIMRSTLITRNDRAVGFGDLAIGDRAYVEGTLMRSDIKPQSGGVTGGDAGVTIEASLVNAYSASARP